MGKRKGHQEEDEKKEMKEIKKDAKRDRDCMIAEMKALLCVYCTCNLSHGSMYMYVCVVHYIFILIIAVSVLTITGSTSWCQNLHKGPQEVCEVGGTGKTQFTTD